MDTLIILEYFQFEKIAQLYNELVVKKCYGQRLWGTSGHGDYVYIAYVKENDTVFVWLKNTHNRSLPYQSCYTYSCLRTKELMVYK